MRYFILSFLLGICYLTSLALGADVPEANNQANVVTSNNVTFTIEHLLSDSFTLRSQIVLISMSDGRQGYQYLDKNSIVQESEIASFRKLLEKNNLYTIRIRNENSPPETPSIIASIPACELQRATFKEDFQLFLDGNGNLLGVSYSTPPIKIAAKCDANQIKDLIKFQTKLQMGTEANAQSIPMTAAGIRPPYLQNVRLGVEEEKKQSQQNQSFLQKYWYVVLALVIYMVMGGGGAPEEKKGEAKAKAQ